MDSESLTAASVWVKLMQLFKAKVSHARDPSFYSWLSRFSAKLVTAIINYMLVPFKKRPLSVPCSVLSCRYSSNSSEFKNMHKNRHKWMVENQNGCSYILLHSYAHTHTFTHPLVHSLIHTCSANTEMATLLPSPSSPFPPTVGTVPHLICNSKFQKEHLLKKMKKINHKKCRNMALHLKP